jgi:hypothetical protein
MEFNSAFKGDTSGIPVWTLKNKQAHTSIITYRRKTLFVFFLFKSGTGQLYMIFTQALTYQDSEIGFVSSKSKEPLRYLTF